MKWVENHELSSSNLITNKKSDFFPFVCKVTLTGMDKISQNARKLAQLSKKFKILMKIKPKAHTSGGNPTTLNIEVMKVSESNLTKTNPQFPTLNYFATVSTQSIQKYIYTN